MDNPPSDSYVFFISRVKADLFEPLPQSALISINDDDNHVPKPKSGWASVYQDQFIDSDYTIDMLQHFPKELLSSMMSAEQASKLKDHIHWLIHTQKIRRIVVHCFAGRARSAAVAQYIHERYHLPLYSGIQAHDNALDSNSDELKGANQMVLTLLRNPTHFSSQVVTDTQSTQESKPDDLVGRSWTDKMLIAILLMLLAKAIFEF